MAGCRGVLLTLLWVVHYEAHKDSYRDAPRRPITSAEAISGRAGLGERSLGRETLQESALTCRLSQWLKWRYGLDSIVLMATPCQP